MGVLFETPTGRAIAIASTTDVPIPMRFEGWEGAQFWKFKSVITQLSIERSGNFTMLHSLQDLISIYVFGERIGSIRLAGLSFSSICGSSDDKTGVELAHEYYEQNSIANRKDALQLQLGTSPSGTFRGFLTAFKVDVVQPESRLAQFAMQLTTFPRRRRAKQ